MKKILLSAIAIVALGTAANAQAINFGVKAGVNFATYGGDDLEGKSSRTDFHVGALAEFKITETFAIQPELIYSRQGAQRDYPVLNLETEEKLSYLNVPVVFKYFVTEGLSIEAGPQVGFLLSAKGETSGEEETDDKDAFESVDFGLVGGLGYELPMGVFFQARYNIGLSNIYAETDINGDGTDEDIKITNSVVALSVGYKF